MRSDGSAHVITSRFGGDASSNSPLVHVLPTGSRERAVEAHGRVLGVAIVIASLTLASPCEDATLASRDRNRPITSNRGD
jgi:hypothetical protein